MFQTTNQVFGYPPEIKHGWLEDILFIVFFPRTYGGCANCLFNSGCYGFFTDSLVVLDEQLMGDSKKVKSRKCLWKRPTTDSQKGHLVTSIHMFIICADGRKCTL